jgi:hypothetical protein
MNYSIFQLARAPCGELMKKKPGRIMTAARLGKVVALFLDAEIEAEVRLGCFKLDYYHPGLNIAYEYDGPEHYSEVGHIERDERKVKACQAKGISLHRWPYYFQLTRDVARYFFLGFYSDNKYLAAIELVYGSSDEQNVLAPGLHRSKHTPANFVHRGANRFFREIDEAPESLRSQVVRSLQIYRKRLGSDREWLLFPENDDRFNAFMKYQPRKEHLQVWFPFGEK